MENITWIFTKFNDGIHKWLKMHILEKGKLVKSRLGKTKEIGMLIYRLKTLEMDPKYSNFPAHYKSYADLWKPKIEYIINELKKENTRQAIISIWDELKKPCWCLIQFLPRNGRLHMIVYSRSQNVDLLPYDLYVFSRIYHEVLSAVSDLYVSGIFIHIICSLHAYIGKENESD